MKFQNFLVLVIGGVFGSTLVMIIVFIIINMCIRKKVAKYSAESANHTKSSYEMNNSFKRYVQEDIRPPLPPRDILDSQSNSNSYEEMPEGPSEVEEKLSLQKPLSSSPPKNCIDFQDNYSAGESYDDVDELQNAEDTNSYEEMPEGPLVADEKPFIQNSVSISPPNTCNNFQDNCSASESYDDVDELQNVQHNSEDVVSLPDYLDVEPPPFQTESDNASENYDDIDELQRENEDTEDYDDVG